MKKPSHDPKQTEKSILNSDNQREIVFKILIVDMSDRLIITSVHQWFVMHTEYRIRIRIRICIAN